MEIKKVKVVYLKSEQALFDLLDQSVWLSVYGLPLTGLPMYSTLACNTYSTTAAFDRLCDGPLTFTVLAIAISSIEMSYSMINGCCNCFSGCLASDASSGHSSERPASKC
jgi:hypothetical protein